MSLYRTLSHLNINRTFMLILIIIINNQSSIINHQTQQAKQLALDKVTYLVIDEADRMLQMGFFDQLEAVSSQVCLSVCLSVNQSLSLSL